MANRYWIGGTGTWDASSTTNWSASSGGAGGATVPTAADAVLFDASSGGGTCTIAATVPCLTLNLTGYTGTIAFGTNKIQVAGNAATIFTQTTSCSVSGTPVVDLTYTGSTGTRVVTALNIAAANTISFNVLGGTDAVNIPSRVRALNFTGFAGTLVAGSRFVHGDLTFSTGMTLSAGTQVLSLRNVTSGSTSILTTNGKTINNPITQDVAGTWVLGDNLTVNPTYALTVDAGVFNANGKNVNIATLNSSGATARTLALGSGTWTVSGSGTAWNCATATNLTVTGAGTISMTSASTKTFAGGGQTWPTLNQGGAGALTVSGSNTFTNITNTVQPTTVTFTSGTTQTVTDFDLTGTAGNLVTVNASTPGSQATLFDVTGTNSVSYVSLTDIAATGGASWEAYTDNGNVDGGGNTGWLFSPINITVFETPYELRSFTEKRRF